MRVRYVCDSCRSIIAEFDYPSLSAERLGLEELPQLVQQAADAVVLSTLCDECAAVLNTPDLPIPPVLPH